MRRLAMMTGLAMLAACSSNEPAPAINLSDNGVPQDAVPPAPAATPAPALRQTPTATGPGTALGLTYLQLEDADVVDAAGIKLAEVEEIDADAAGTIKGLVVELPDDRRVRIGLGGLSLAPAGAGWNVRTGMTAAQLAALPARTN